MTKLRRVLVIAGSDSSGGAGLEADQRVLAAHHCYALTATTALTAQNTLGVQDIHVVPTEFVRKQISAGLEDVGADVVKIGMLASKDTVLMVSNALRHHQVPVIVLDPVMVSTSGSQLLPSEAVSSVRTNLLPITTVLTPNIPEGLLLLRDSGIDVPDPENLDDAITLAEQLHKLGPRYILLKGGHLPLTAARKKPELLEEASIVVDILYDGTSVHLIETEYSRSRNTHGTGCSLASAIAANLTENMEVLRAVREACRFVEAGIKTSIDIGQGHGPINHFHSLYSLPFSPGHFLDYVLERPDVRPLWESFTKHEFVNRLADATLPLNSFRDYLIQDYLYLVHFARSNALAAYKNQTMEGISAVSIPSLNSTKDQNSLPHIYQETDQIPKLVRTCWSTTADASSLKSAKIVLHIEREMALHLDYCASFGLSKEDIEFHKESQACTAYSRYILDVGQSEDWLALQVALSPCLIGYGAIAQRLHTDEGSVRTDNKYWKWVENYVAEDYSAAVRLGSELLETHMRNVSRFRVEELVRIFKRATELEIGFWDMGLQGQHSVEG
ncbi:trifunctional hydroxymethylpyrimidine kinase/phosphomethylpyrimidine kinase/thiaminase [Ophidiomyces ophidiicola]|nr:trifunctional hydroxymethylpyrimidine kinase/phosphomethylpyrimidine kinase/thiaminase [Ophidiomyces ophidiicola]